MLDISNTLGAIIDPSLDSEYFGDGTISGTVLRKGEPGIYRVLLYRMHPRFQLVGETYSDESGAYTFQYIHNIPNEYIVVAIDHTIGDTQPFAISSHISPS